MQTFYVNRMLKTKQLILQWQDCNAIFLKCGLIYETKVKN